MKLIFSLSLLFFVNNAFAGWMDSAEEALKKTQKVTNEMIDAGKEVGNKALDAGAEALDASKEVGEQALDAFKEALEVTKETLSTDPQTPEERFADTWGDVLQHLDEGLVIFDKIKEAPDSVFIGEDKQSLREDFNVILDDIIILLDDPGIKENRDRIDSLRQKIDETKKEIAGYREKRVIAPRKSMVKTTKGGYDKRIKLAERDMADYETEIEKIHLQLVEQFRDIGLSLNLNQVTVLLSRVDSENIIQMSVVFDVLKKITKQLMALTKSGGEEIKTAKRYYGMHVVLLEMVIHMQGKYVSKIDSDFLPKIDGITEKTISLYRRTKRNISRESNANRRTIYQNNLHAQELTMKVARLYVDNLKDQREKVVRAKQKVAEDFRLANNTYETVEVSADLVNLLNTSQDSFEAVMDLQVPEIIPFESLEMQKKYQELSKMIKNK